MKNVHEKDLKHQNSPLQGTFLITAELHQSVGQSCLNKHTIRFKASIRHVSSSNYLLFKQIFANSYSKYADPFKNQDGVMALFPVLVNLNKAQLLVIFLPNQIYYVKVLPFKPTQWVVKLVGHVTRYLAPKLRNSQRNATHLGD